MLHGALPTEEIVKAMFDKITAEEKLNIKVQHLLETPNVESSKKVPKSKAASKNAEKKLVVTKGYMMNQGSPATSPSDSSWDPILDFPDRRQLKDFLTEQERNDLRNLVLSVSDFCKPTPDHNDGLQGHEDGDNDDGNGNYKSSRPADCHGWTGVSLGDCMRRQQLADSSSSKDQL